MYLKISHCVTHSCFTSPSSSHPSYHVPPVTNSLQFLQPRGFTLLCLCKSFPSSWNILFLLFSLEIPIFLSRLSLIVAFSVNVLHDLFPLLTPELRSSYQLYLVLSLALILIIQTMTWCYNFIFLLTFSFPINTMSNLRISTC